MCACESNPTNVEKASELFQRYIEGPYGLRDMSDYKELIEKGYTVEEYYKFAKIFDDGIVKDEELDQLAAEDRYHKDFLVKLRRLRGGDDAEALRRRVKWLGDNCVKKWYRFDYPPENRAVMVDELANLFRAEGVEDIDRPYITKSLMKALFEDEYGGVVYEAAERAFGKISPDPTAALALLDGYKEGMSMGPTRYSAIAKDLLITKFGPGITPTLIVELRGVNEYPGERETAAELLGMIVPTSEEVISALTAAASGDTSLVVRNAAKDALEHIQNRKIQNTSGNI